MAVLEAGFGSRLIVIAWPCIWTTMRSAGRAGSFPVMITDSGPVTQQREGSISAQLTGMFKHEVGPGAVTWSEGGAAAFAATAGDVIAATRLIAMAGASARSEIRNGILPPINRIAREPSYR